MSEEHTQQGHGLIVEEAQPQTKRPPLYQVVLLNDDYTPMEFVVDVLEHIFGLIDRTAPRVMLEVHTQGQGHLRRVHLRDRRDQGRAGDHLRPAAPASLLCTMEEA
jgi:ATP-dependent Clp protease adaptor protein ClpS